MTAATLRLDGELTIYSAQETRQAVLQSLAGLAADDAPAVLEIDLSGVGEIDTAGVQLLMAATRHAGERQKNVRLVGCSAAVAEVLDLLGVAAYFADPAAGSGGTA